MIYNKTLDPADYTALQDFVELFEAVAQAVPGRIDHYHRRWEYSLALSAALSYGCKTILEIGSGGSLFAPMAALSGLSVTCLDPSANVSRAKDQATRLGVAIDWQQIDLAHFTAPGLYDAVLCLSTIEHVADDRAFFVKALSLARRLAMFTTDFSLDGGRYSPHHLRTYTPTSLWALTKKAPGWRLTDRPAWQDNGRPIFDQYNFASLCLCTT